MIDPDYRLCPVRAISCTHHAHCVRAQLKPHATRQAWLTPNRRGDECQYFAPIEAYDLILAGSDAANTEPRTNAEAGGVQSVGLALPPTRPVHALGLSNHETVAATPHGDARTFPERGARVIGVTVHEPSGVPSIPEGLTPEQQDRAIRLNALRIIFGNS